MTLAMSLCSLLAMEVEIVVRSRPGTIFTRSACVPSFMRSFPTGKCRPPSRVMQQVMLLCSKTAMEWDTAVRSRPLSSFGGSW